MRKGLKSLIAPMLIGAMSSKTPFEFEGGFSIRTPYFNPDYRRPASKKELREFDIRGRKIMAYSRKDAIKRLKHKNK